MVAAIGEAFESFILKDVRRLLIRFVLVSTLVHIAPAAQSAPVPVVAAPAKSQYFSGFVTEQKASLLAVSRKDGKETVHRSFIIDSRTKVEGKLRPNARVTVRFETRPEGDFAIRIIVRDK